MSGESDTKCRATVLSLSGMGSGRYATTTLSERYGKLSAGAMVTFSIPIWGRARDPMPGQVVMLGEIMLFNGGWRALSAEPIHAKE